MPPAGWFCHLLSLCQCCLFISVFGNTRASLCGLGNKNLVLVLATVTNLSQFTWDCPSFSAENPTFGDTIQSSTNWAGWSTLEDANSQVLLALWAAKLVPVVQGQPFKGNHWLRPHPACGWTQRHSVGNLQSSGWSSDTHPHSSQFLPSALQGTTRYLQR